MRIKDDRNIFKLEVVGYQFPGVKDIDDGNWLNIRLEVSNSDKTWRLEEPILQTFELAELSKWLISTEDAIEFLEPTISFHKKQLSEKKFLVRIFFSDECHIDNEFMLGVDIEKGQFLELKVSDSTLKECSDELRASMDKYPIVQSNSY